MCSTCALSCPLLYCVSQLVCDIRSLATKLVRVADRDALWPYTYSATLPPALGAGQQRSELLAPFRNFGCVANQMDTSSLAGGLANGQPDMFINVLELSTKLPRRDWSLRMLFSRIHECVDCCDAIRRKTKVTVVTVPLHQIVAMVEDLFCRILPIPCPPKRVKKMDLYTDEEQICSDEMCRRFCKDIVALACQYQAASRSLPGGRARDGAMGVTMGAMLSIFNAVLTQSPNCFRGPFRNKIRDPENDGGCLWTLVTTSFRGESLAHIVQRSLFFSPHTLRARHEILQYLEYMTNPDEAEQPPEALFDFEWNEEMMFENKSCVKTIGFCADLGEAVDEQGDWDKAGDMFLYSTMAPRPVEFTAARDLCFLFQLGLEPSFEVAGMKIRKKRPGSRTISVEGPEEKVWTSKDPMPGWRTASKDNKPMIAVKIKAGGVAIKQAPSTTGAGPRCARCERAMHWTGSTDYDDYGCNGCERGGHGERWHCTRCRFDMCEGE